MCELHNTILHAHIHVLMRSGSVHHQEQFRELQEGLT